MHIHIFGFVHRYLSKHQRNEGIFVRRNGIKERMQGMIDWKDCIVPVGAKGTQELPGKAVRLPRKCSTCSSKSCTVRGTVVNWLHCGKWIPEGVTKNGK